MLPPIQFSGIQIKRKGSNANTEAKLREAMDQYNPAWSRWFHLSGSGKSLELRQNAGNESISLLETVAEKLQELGIKTGTVTALTIDKK
jgi:hypothetical protein